MQTYRTMLIIQDSSQITLWNLPFRPGQLVEVLVIGEEERDTLTQKMASLFQKIQSLPQMQQLTEEEIAAELPRRADVAAGQRRFS